ncbi:TIGR02302 family protein [Tistlia consotensis]|uniref:TIGR02302 family protein n=1 Tax=Tistlia consotensis USBA 355 TaxID=560819 RepID=A0A1Y6B4I6_9PROT|nr:TIGR02302 family protein [Tistlia consotensis]SME91597.1 TIGR02302 family protein [Tistlia consotensis USBA 355]SNR27484.1 TIGR02302 family protein [Tistlia consotensis]
MSEQRPDRFRTDRPGADRTPTAGRRAPRSDEQQSDLPLRGYRLRLALSRAALFWESLWPALFPFGCVVGLFLALALMDLLSDLGGWLHLAVLVGFALAAAASLAWAARRVRLPGREAARRRLERDSGVAHRPLQALEDSLATDPADPDAQALWRAHRRRLAEQLRRLRVAPPAAGWARVDGFALRAAVGLLLVIGLVVGGGDWRFRLSSAVTPSLGATEASLPTQLDVWLNPPSYTGQPPRYLDPAKAADGTIEVPTGSALLAQVQGGRGDAVMSLGGAETPFQRYDAGSLRLQRSIETGAEASDLPLEIRRGERTLGAWTLHVLPDHAPSVEYLKPPAPARRGALELAYRAADDYGLVGLQAVIRRVDKPDGPPLSFDLGLPSGEVKQSEGTAYRDLTPHPWAGIPVTVQLEARDATGQTGTTEAFQMVMPERVFQHPVARRLIELRKQLTLHPEQRMPVIEGLTALSRRPEHFANDLVVALALVVAERRLVHDHEPTAIGEVQELLWDTALHIEEGEVALAERRLRNLQQQLMDALEKGAPDEEIDRLMNEVQQALDEFLRQMAEQAMKQAGQQPPAENQPLPPDAQVLQRDDLQKMIEQARQLAKAGDRDKARELLAQLQQMLENLQAMPMQQRMNQQAQKAQQMMQSLQEMMRRQQELMDRSFQRSQQGKRQQLQQPGDGKDQGKDPGRSSNAGDAQDQEALRRQLGGMMRKFGDMTGEIPRSLGQAEQSMRDARDALKQDQPGNAVQPQADALDQLQQGLETMLESFAQQMRKGQGKEGNQAGERPGEGRDPFGRGPQGQGLEGNDRVQIPTGSELRRAREILDELRRRREEVDRPPVELDYLDRLLRQF